VTAILNPPVRQKRLPDPPPFVVKGQLVKLFAARDDEILFDGPRGTGKSRPMAEYIVRYALAYQGCRILVVRKNRSTMGQSTLVTLEQVIQMLHPPALKHRPNRDHVLSYFIGSSEIIIKGCEDEQKLRSVECSGVWADECNELSLDNWELIQGSIRWPVGAWNFMIGTCNPDSDQHWLWLRFKAGKLRRIQSSHKDNPSVTEKYLTRLGNLTGVRRKRYFEGIWTAAEGQVYDNYNAELNEITVKLKPGTDEPDYDSLGISWFFAAVDWGHTAAGVVGVWGVDLKGRLYEVAEVYFTRKGSAWWCNVISDLNEKFKLRAIVCDPSDSAMISDFNLRLGYHPKSPDALAFGANNKRANSGIGDLAGINLVREMIGPQADGKPALYFVRGNQPMGIDQNLRDVGLPCATTEEVPGYVYAKTPEGKMVKDVTDKNCVDHGLDQTRYACMFARYKDMSDPLELPKDDPESYGALYGHNALMATYKAAERDGENYDEIIEEIIAENQAHNGSEY
jgi:PBSX family phage terminase large subunit